MTKMNKYVSLGDHVVALHAHDWTRLISASPDKGIIIGGPANYVGADVYKQEALFAVELDNREHLLLTAVIYNQSAQKVGQIWQSTWAMVYPGKQSQPTHKVREDTYDIELVRIADDRVQARLSKVAPDHYECEGVFYAPSGDCMVVTRNAVYKNPDKDPYELLPFDES